MMSIESFSLQFQIKWKTRPKGIENDDIENDECTFQLKFITDKLHFITANNYCIFLSLPSPLVHKFVITCFLNFKVEHIKIVKVSPPNTSLSSLAFLNFTVEYIKIVKVFPAHLFWHN